MIGIRIHKDYHSVIRIHQNVLRIQISNHLMNLMDIVNRRGKILRNSDIERPGLPFSLIIYIKIPQLLFPFDFGHQIPGKASVLIENVKRPGILLHRSRPVRRHE